MKRGREQEEHEARIERLMDELDEYAQSHGYSDEDLCDAAYKIMVSRLGISRKRDASVVLRKLEEHADGFREVLLQSRKKRV